MNRIRCQRGVVGWASAHADSRHGMRTPACKRDSLGSRLRGNDKVGPTRCGLQETMRERVGGAESRSARHRMRTPVCNRSSLGSRLRGNDNRDASCSIDRVEVRE